MKKLINRPEAVVAEMLDGLVQIYPNLRKLPGYPVLLRSDAEAVRNQQIALISGGGSGHEPAHAGYVGAGMLSAAVAGEVFTSPPADSVVTAIRAVAGPPGVLLIVKNYTGDRLNFGLAAEIARADGIPVETVIVADDVALAATEERGNRRGIAGTVLVHKIAGAAAAQNRELKQVARLAQSAADDTATIGLSLSAGTVPAVGKPGYILEDNEVELGLGIHGEPGIRRMTLETADELAEKIIRAIISAHSLKPKERIAVLVNNLGATTNMELAIFARHALHLLELHGLTIDRVYAGTFMTSLEAAGVSVSVMRVDDERVQLMDTATLAPAWPNAAGAKPRRVQPEGSEFHQVKSFEAPQSARSAQSVALQSVIENACQSLIRAESELTEMDRIVGDGDLGLNLARTAKAILNGLPTYPLHNPVEALRRLSVDVQQFLGGSSGPLYGVFLLGAANSLSERYKDPSSWATAFMNGCKAIGELGGASPGDRTMLDALLPFGTELSNALAAKYPLSEALESAARAARQGAEATCQMKPKRGRSSQLGERALGHPDPGAVAASIWLSAAVGQLQSCGGRTGRH